MELADRRDAAGGFFDTGCAVTCATVLMTSANGPTRIPAPRLRLEPLGLRPAESRHPGAHRRSMAEMRMSGLTLDIKATFRKSPVREPRKRKKNECARSACKWALRTSNRRRALDKFANDRLKDSNLLECRVTVGSCGGAIPIRHRARFDFDLLGNQLPRRYQP
jgi:hypothetical protein